MRWRRLFPIVGTLEGYDRDHARSDLIAGLTTAVMLIPQAMGYAMLAGLPPIVGLYASVAPLVIYALVGTSRQLAVGPVAMDSLLVAMGIAPLAANDPAQYLSLALLLAAMTGIIQVVMGLARLGFLVNFLSHPVLSGFTSAAALIIGFSQLSHLLGFSIPRSPHVHEVVARAASNLGATHLPTLTVGAVSIAALIALKRYAPRFPRALAVVIGGSLAVWGLGLHGGGVAIVGEVPSGLPGFTAVPFDAASIEALLPIALTIAVVGFMEAIAVSKQYARTEGYAIDPNRELIGLGLANVGAAHTGGYPITGGFSRTAVNAQAGAKTSIASLVTAGVIALTLAWLTPLFHYLPKAVLAAIIMTAVFGLIDLGTVQHLWRTHRADLGLLGATFLATLTLGIQQGVAVGVLLSLVVHIARTTRPHVAELGRLPNTEVYRNVSRFPEAEITDGVVALRIDAQLYFANASFLGEAVDDVVGARGADVWAVVLDASGINQIDTSGEVALRTLDQGLRARGITLLLACAKGPVRDVLSRSGLADELEGRAFLTVEAAIAAGAALRPEPLDPPPLRLAPA